jgi:hypothetical protein
MADGDHAETSIFDGSTVSWKSRDRSSGGHRYHTPEYDPFIKTKLDSRNQLEGLMR